MLDEAEGEDGLAGGDVQSEKSICQLKFHELKYFQFSEIVFLLRRIDTARPLPLTSPSSLRIEVLSFS
jgi:hypothetical protein